MRPKPIFIFLFLSYIFTQCVYDNAEEKYTNLNVEAQPKGEIAWFPLNGNLNDSTGNQTMISVAGALNYTAGINNETGKGIGLNGTDNYITISPGYLDTIAILFWIKSAGEITNPNRPVIFDYGHNGASAALVDGATGATNLALNLGESTASSSDLGEESYLNTTNKYSLVYIEAGGETNSFWFKGYLQNGKAKVLNKSYQFPNSLDPVTDMIYIGRASQKENIVDSYFKGSIDEIHIFNRFLTSDEITNYLNLQAK